MASIWCLNKSFLGFELISFGKSEISKALNSSGFKDSDSLFQISSKYLLQKLFSIFSEIKVLISVLYFNPLKVKLDEPSIEKEILSI